ncbi:MAG TPA: DUF2848 domain-containing protein [Micropepsaceae bacterium]|nr:DUF2848 domain-containing protein [Micropepsaceae bacterium]
MNGRVLSLVFEDAAGILRRDTRITEAVIAGWTGRDAAAVEKHIQELAALGVKRPATTPIFYRAAAARLTIESSIEVLGSQSSGEVEFVLLETGGRLWVSTGSDHTDREVEAYGVSVSKQMCDKPVAETFWPFGEVASHWDRLVLRSFATMDGKRTLYQEGTVAGMRHPEDLIRRYAKGRLNEGTLMFCGTLPVHGGVRPAVRFEFELEDPVLKRKIAHHYDIISLPNLG